MESKKKRIMVFGLLLISVILFSVAITYAFFAGILGETKNEVVKVHAGTMELVFSDNDTLGNIDRKLNFGDTIEKEFKIENSGTLDVYAKINWENLTNTYLEKSLTYTLEYKTSETGEWQNAYTTSRSVPRREGTSTVELSNHLLILSGVTYYYKLTIKYNNLDIDQTNDLNATLSTKFSLEEGTAPAVLMVAPSRTYQYEKIWLHKDTVKRIVIEDKINSKVDAAYTYDISESQDKSVMSYLVPIDGDSSKYTLYIQGNGGVLANKDSSYLFSGFTNLESIDGLEKLNTSIVTSMVCLFYLNPKLVSLDLSNFDTSKVTDMNFMFNSCSKLTLLDVSSFDTGNVIDMNSMFSNCSSLPTLDVSNFDTSKVTGMNSMFAFCSSLPTLDVSNFDTSKVTGMNFMFYGCSKLTSLDVSNFDTSKVTGMNSMFAFCSSLPTLDVSSFDTGNVINMNRMFHACSGLTSLNISNFDISSVTNSTDVFYLNARSVNIIVPNETVRDFAIGTSGSTLTISNFTIV